MHESNNFLARAMQKRPFLTSTLGILLLYIFINLLFHFLLPPLKAGVAMLVGPGIGNLLFSFLGQYVVIWLMILDKMLIVVAIVLFGAFLFKAGVMQTVTTKKVFRRKRIKWVPLSIGLFYTFCFVNLIGLQVTESYWTSQSSKAPVKASGVPEAPVPFRYVNDYVNILSADEKDRLEHKLRSFKDCTSTQVVVVIVPTVQPDDISEYSFKLGRQWGIGQKSKNNGVVFTWATEDRKTFIATGYGLEGAIPDAFAKRILREHVTPHFKKQEWIQGLDEGTDEILRLAIADFPPLKEGGQPSPTEAPLSAASTPAMPQAVVVEDPPFSTRDLFEYLQIFFLIVVFGGIPVMLIMSPSSRRSGSSPSSSSDDSLSSSSDSSYSSSSSSSDSGGGGSFGGGGAGDSY